MVFAKQLQDSAKFILSSMKNNVHLKLIIVVIIIPTVCNSIQFWVTDNILKKEEESIVPLEKKELNQEIKIEEIPSDIKLNVDDKVNEIKTS